MEHETDKGIAYRVNCDHLGIWQMQSILLPTETKGAAGRQQFDQHTELQRRRP
jgi:hypothetical protein